MTKPITIDEFLENNSSLITATVESVEGDNNSVKITPWHPNAGCSCSDALILEKSVIAGVTPTGQFHFCCNKTFPVVALSLRKDATLPLSKIFQRTSGRKIQSDHVEVNHLADGMSFSRNIGPSVRAFSSQNLPMNRQCFTSNQCPPGMVYCCYGGSHASCRCEYGGAPANMAHSFLPADTQEFCQGNPGGGANCPCWSCRFTPVGSYCNCSYCCIA